MKDKQIFPKDTKNTKLSGIKMSKKDVSGEEGVY